VIRGFVEGRALVYITKKKKKSTRLPAETLCNQNNNSNNKHIHPKLFKKFLSRTHADKSRINKH
jgi:hypothetical protein